jgi:uncharacterized protein with LGFP repeats
MAFRVDRHFTLSGAAAACSVLACGALAVGSVGIESVTATASPAAARQANAPVTADDEDAQAVTPKIVRTSVPIVAAGARSRIDNALRKSGADIQGERSTGAQLAAHLVRTGLAPFEVAGVTWGHGSVVPGITVRVRTMVSGHWADWTQVQVDGDGPSASEKSRARSGTEPLWTPKATGIEVAVSTPTGTAPRGLAVSTIDPGRSRFDAKAVARTSATLSTAGMKSGSVASVVSTPAASPGRALTRDGFPEMPAIITRKQWGADPKLTDDCWDPVYGDSLKMVFIHHTVNSNSYTAAQAPALMRGILAYHTQSRNWCDIGYNFVVDRFGNIYEGRRGGMRLPVRGAHTGIYNTDSTGISMLGNFDTSQLTTAMQNALVRLVGWRLGTAYETGTGTERLAGKTFQRISGHRDAMATACPGKYGYAFLPTLRARVDWYLAPMKTHILSAYESKGGTKGPLGRVYQGEMGLAGGHTTIFQHGRMYYKAATGRPVATLMRGAVLSKYRTAGGPTSDLGYPRSSQLTYNRGAIKEVRFEHGNIYASRSTGAHALDGKILTKYYALNSFTGRLGLPTTDSVTHVTYVSANFVNGRIVYTFETKRFTITYKQ